MSTKKTSLIFLFVLIVTLSSFIGLGLTTSAQGEEAVYKWKFATQTTEGDVRTNQIKRFIDLVRQYSQNRIEITLYPGESLIKAAATFDAIRAGTLQLAYLPDPYIVGKVPCADWVILPYSYSAKGAAQLRDAGIFDVYNAVLRELGLSHVFACWTPGCNAVSSKQINTLDDLKGQRMRHGNRPTAILFEQFGAPSVTMPESDVYMAAERGGVDACTTSLGAYVGLKLYEVMPYNIKPYHVDVAALSVVMNAKLRDKLPEDLKEALSKAAIEAEEGGLSNIMLWQTSNVEPLVNKGLIKMCQLPPADVEKLHTTAIDVVYKQFQENGGKCAEDLLNILLKYGNP